MVIVCGGLQEAEYIRVNVDLAIGIPGWSPALVLGVGMGSAFDDRAWSVLGKSQTPGCGADLILGNLGNSQGWGGERRRERLPAGLLNASGGLGAETQGEKRDEGRLRESSAWGHSQTRVLIWGPLYSWATAQKDRECECG